MAKSYLIKDTTKEERIKIIERSLNTCGTPCEGCTLCDGITGLPDAWSMYKPYIDGEKEISEINEEIRTGFVR